MPLLDAHNHVQEEELQPLLPEVLRRAREAGVTAQIVNGTGEQDWAAVRRLAETEPGVVPAYGLHPWFVGERSRNWREVLEEYLTAPAALGEIGLDRHQPGLDRPAQEMVFREQLALAARLERPVVIHCLQAWGWLLEILREMGPPPAGFMLHGYGGAADLLPELTRLGGYFSFAGTVLDPARRRARAALQAVPRDRLLLETDAPAMPPPQAYCQPGTVHHEPANLPLIMAGVAELLGMTSAALADLTWENGQRWLRVSPGYSRTPQGEGRGCGEGPASAGPSGLDGHGRPVRG